MFFLSKFLKNNRILTILNLFGIKKFFVIFTSLVFFSFSSGSEKTPWPFPAKSVEDAVFMVELFFSHNPSNILSRGTAFAIQLEGEFYFVTNFHVIETFLLGITDWRIISRTGEIFKKENIEGIVRLSFPYDLALIKIKQKRYKGPVLRHVDKYTIGKEAYALGFLDKRLQRAELSELIELSPSDISSIKNDMSSFGGMSGSPVFNNKGEVVGVLTAAGEYELTFIKFDLVKKILKAKQGPYGNLKKWWEIEIRTVIEMSDGGDPFAQVVLAQYKKHLFTQTHDGKYMKEALVLYGKAAVQGYFTAQIHLGLLLSMVSISEVGEDTFLQLLEFSKKLLLEAAIQKKSVLIDLFLAIVLTNEKSSNEDFIEGWNILKKLSDKGIKPAQEHLKKIQAAYTERFSDDGFTESTERRDDGCTNELFR